MKAITWVSYYSSISVTDWWLISKLIVNLIFEFLNKMIMWISIPFRYYKGCVWGIMFIFILVSHASIEFSTSDCGLFQMNQCFWFSQDLLQWFYFVWIMCWCVHLINNCEGKWRPQSRINRLLFNVNSKILVKEKSTNFYSVTYWVLHLSNENVVQFLNFFMQCQQLCSLNITFLVRSQ